MGVAAQFLPVRNNLSGIPGADAREGQQSGAVGLVDVQPGQVDERLQPRKDAVRHHIGLGKIGLAAEAPALLPIILYGLCLLFAEAQSLQVLHTHCVGIEAETLHPPRLLPHLLYPGAVRRIPAKCSC